MTANDFFNDFKKNIMGGMNVCKLARVDKFNPANMTVDATPFPTGDNAMIVNIPVATVKSRDFIVYYPLEAGDHVVLLFADGDTDGVMLGQDEAPTERTHDISDCVCLGGFSLFNQDVGIEDKTSLTLKSAGGATVTISKGDTVEIKGKALYNGKEIAVKGDATTDGAVIV